ncbi:MAG: hypothetical protein ONB44_04570 [candidate division KSB1 bacterium]|nr:hypothetical protein [candidate division KSB1 bacterium]MDZ7301397.1 hypothetical protein [candidate division KSB1 bacterium]MDZ7310718.1 hypothetical protein [candidate division KSB1 bacterium]
MVINKTRILLGGALLVIGLLSLLSNLRLFHLSETYVVSLIFVGTGIVLMQHGWPIYGQATSRKWTFYFGSALVLVGAMIFIDEARFLPDELIGTIWLWLGAGFLYRIYHRNPKHWWVLLFAGPLFTLGFVVLLSGIGWLRDDTAWVLINLGFAATLAFLYSIRSPERKSDWAKYPAVVFFLIAVFILLAKRLEGTLPFVISGLFILAGLYLIYRTVRADFGSSGQDHPNNSTELPQVS